MPAPEKLTEQVKLTLCESMLRELQDLALIHDRSVSEYIRHVLTIHLHGHTRMLRERPDKSMD